MNLIEAIVAGILFIGSSGLFFNDRFRKNRALIVAAGLFALVSAVLTVLAINEMISLRIAEAKLGTNKPGPSGAAADSSSTPMEGGGEMTPTIITIGSGGTVFWGKIAIASDELPSRLAKLSLVVPQPKFAVSADPAAIYQDVAAVRIQLQKAGFFSFLFHPSGLNLYTPLPPIPDRPPQPEPPPIELEIGSEGSLIWNSEMVTRDQLEANLKVQAARYPQPKIRMKPHRLARYDVVDDVHLLVKQAGLEDRLEELPLVLPDFVVGGHEPALTETEFSTR